MGLGSGASIAFKGALGSCLMLWGPSPPFLAPRLAPVWARGLSTHCGAGLFPVTRHGALWAGSGPGVVRWVRRGGAGPDCIIGTRAASFSADFGWAHGRCGIPLCGASLALPRCGLVGFRFRRALWHTGDLAHWRFGGTRFRQSFVFGGLWFVGTRFGGCLGHSSAYILGSSVCCSFRVGAYCCTFCYTVWAV